MQISVEVFKDFNFNQAPSQSPLDELLEETLGPYLGSRESGRLNKNSTSGALLPLALQTGIGKTYTAMNFILTQMLAQIQDDLKNINHSQPKPKRPLYYVTDLIDNVTSARDELLQLIESQKVFDKPRFNPLQQEYLRSQILYIPNQATQLLSCSEKMLTQIMNAFQLEKNADIKKRLGEFLALKENVNYAEMSFTIESQASWLYSYFVTAIQKRQRGRQPILFEDDEDLKSAIETLLPGERIRNQSSHVLFLTTSKFLKGFHHTHALYRPLTNVNQALLIMDEIDKQNEVILREICEQKAPDLISLIRTLTANLREYKLEHSERYAEIESFFEPLRERLELFSQTWQLEYAFNTEGESLADSPVNLFSDRSFTHVSSATHNLLLKSDHIKLKNFIYTSEKKEGLISSKNNRLTRFVNEADMLYRWFLDAMQKSIFQYWENIKKLEVNKRENRSFEGSFQVAVQSILTHFNLTELTSLVNDSFSTISWRKRQMSMVRLDNNLSYHHIGFKLVNVALNPDTIDTVNCNTSSLNLSPSGLLADMVDSGAVILGISATASSQTVIHNFDFDYLKKRLSDRLLNLTRSQEKQVSDYYKRLRNYEKHNIAIIVQYQNSHDAFLDPLLVAYKPEVVNTNLIFNLHFNIEAKGVDYARTWLSKLLVSLKAFIQTSDNRYMLALLNRNIDDKKHGDLNQFISFCCELWAEEFQTQVKLYPKVKASWIKHHGYQAITDYLATHTGKVIVLSTYAAMGAGKNPDYPVNLEFENETLIRVTDLVYSKELRTDIDCLYLEKPTHLLLSIQENDTADNLCQFHQILSLQESGEISTSHTMRWIRQQLKGMNRIRALQEYYQTSDYQAAVRKYIEQAVGRTGRTSLKRNQIYIFAAAELKDILAQEGRDLSTCSHEYAALVLHAQSQTRSIHMPVEREQRRQINLAIRNNKEGMQIITGLVSRLHHAPATTRDIQEWKALRKQLLCHPCAVALPDNFNRLYLHSPTRSYYRYEGELDGLAANFKFFDNVAKGSLVSEQSSRLPILMKNQCVHNWFKNKDFCIQWEQDAAYIMTPIMFTNIYKAALGEQAVEAILSHYGFKFNELDAEIYERFDAELILDGVATRVWLDAKYWQHDDGSTSEDFQTYSDKIQLVESECGTSKFVYINALGDSDKPIGYLDENFIPTSPQRAKVIEIPALIDERSAMTNENAIMELRQWLYQN